MTAAFGFPGRSSVIMNTLLQLYLFLLTILTVFLPAQTRAQNFFTDTAMYHPAFSHIIQLYTDSVKENLRVYNGFEFTGAYRSSAGHPFFEYAEPRKGDIFFEGTRYPSVLLAYDITHDELIFINPRNHLYIKLVSPKVDGFIIDKHSFVYLHSEKSFIDFPGDGFYELLYEGEATVLAKRTKKLRHPAKAEGVSRFVSTDNYFVRKDSTYFHVDSKRSLLQIYRDRKPELTKFMQTQKLDFKKDPELTIIKVIDYYSQLKN